MNLPGRGRGRRRSRDRQGRSRRRLRWALLVLTGLTALLYVVGSAAEAGASPPDQAAVGAPAQPADCKWEVVDMPGGSKTAQLKCGGKVVPHTDVDNDKEPPLPNGCKHQRVTHGLGDQGPTDEIVCESWVPLADNSKEWVQCRDEHDFWFDDHMSVQIPKDAPQWWKDEIRIESEADEGRGCQIAKHVPQLMCRQRPLRDDRDLPGMLPDQCWGTYPSANYGLNWDDGGPFDFTEKMQAWTGSFMFTIGKGAIVIVLWMVGWAFTFDITTYTVFVDHISASYQTSIVGPFDLKDVVWFVLIVWCGFAALRGKIGMAGGEIVITMVVVGIMTVLLGHQGAYMNKVATLMDETSARLLVAGQAERCLPKDHVSPELRNRPQADCRDGEVLVESNPQFAARLDDELRPLQQHIHEAFVEQPYAYLNWGRVATDKCLEAQNHIVGVGFNADGWPERHMERAGCKDLADFNHKSREEGMLGAFLTMLVALVVAFFLGLMAITVVISKFLVALLFAILPFAAVGAVLPGAGRRLAWSWFGTLLQLVVAVLLMSFLLSLLLLGVDEVLRTTADVNLVQRWFIVLLTVGAVYFGRKRLLASSKSLGENFADSMTRLSPGGRNWSGASKGIDLTGIDRGAKHTLVGAGVGVAAVGSAVGNRLRERRVARRGYRNLERMERSRERPRLEYRLDGYRYHPASATPAPLSTTTPALPTGGAPRGGAPGGGGSRPSGGGGSRPSGGGGSRPSGGGGSRSSGGGARRGGSTGSGGRPSDIPEGFTQSAGGAWTGPAAVYDAHNAPTPAPAAAAAPTRGSGGAPRRGATTGAAAGGGGHGPAPLARERIEVLYHRRAPRTWRQPVGHVVDRVRAGFPLFGTNAQAQRYAERAFDQINNPRPRGRGIGWR